MMPNANGAKLQTILVVDDNEAVLQTVATILDEAHFRVLSAPNAEAALKLSDATEGVIDMLLSDVDMRAMSGPDLGEKLKKRRPNIHVMLMSGGAHGNLLVLNYGWAFIQKPFVPGKLVQMVLSVLQTPNRSQPGGHKFDTRMVSGDES